MADDEGRGSSPPRGPAGAATEVDWDAEVRAHGRRVVVSLMALGLPIDQAEDLAQRAWMRLMEQGRAGRLAEVRLPGLAIAQARFLALSARERGEVELRRLAAGGEGLCERIPSGEASPEERALSREQLDRALATLEGSSESARAVFFHVYSDPAPSHAAVAERVGLSVQRVRQILCELRRRMREALEEDDR